jgi:nucleoid-associated protein YgaU
MQLDRVPGADQSRLVLKELFTGMKLDQTNMQDSQIQRSLNMRNAENSTQQTLTLKPGQIDAVRELINAVKNQDLITKDASKTIEATHTIDAKTAANILTTKQGAEADLASKQEQNKSVKDAITKDAQNKQQDANSNMPDRRLVNSETKAESNQVKNNNAENGTGNKQNQNQDDKKDKAEANKGKKPEQNENELATIMANKMRELKEKELKEKEKQKEKDQEKSKKDPQQKTRLKYRVKEGDTLSAISAKFLNNAELAAAIFHINRTVIPVITHNEKTYASLPINSMIWIPCDDDLETFKDSGIGKQYEHIGFAGVQYGSAEEELAARFGRRWFGPTKEERADKATRIANIEKVLGREEEIARPQFKGDRDKRRANIEAILGPLSERPADGRARYTVRLGETLKSIAVKHPSINNVEAWKLIASLNGMETATDSKGTPIAILKRGTVIILPSKAEVEKFLAERKLPQLNFAPTAKAVLTSM